MSSATFYAVLATLALVACAAAWARARSRARAGEELLEACHSARSESDVAQALRLVDRADVNAVDLEYGETALDRAEAAPRLAAVAAALRARGGRTFGELAKAARAWLPGFVARALGSQLHRACCAEDFRAACRLLLRGADPDFRSGSTQSWPLAVVITNMTDAAISPLIRAGARLDLVDDYDGCTAFMLACAYNPDVAFLLAEGAPLDVISKEGSMLGAGKSALDYAECCSILTNEAAVIRRRGGRTGEEILEERQQRVVDRRA